MYHSRNQHQEKSKTRSQAPHVDVWTALMGRVTFTLMGLLIGLEQKNSFVRLWEIPMCHIPRKFPHKSYFLLTHDWSVQRNKIVIENRFKIEISTYIFGYSVEFEVCKKINGFHRNAILLPRLDFKKFWHTAMADSATDWEIIIVTKSCVYRENVLDEKWYSFVLRV